MTMWVRMWILVACWTASSLGRMIGPRPNATVITRLMKATQDHLVGISGGQEVHREDAFPFVVSVRQNGEHICGGSILDAHWVLSAAHCFDHNQDVEMIEISAGTLNIHERSSHAQIRAVKQIFRHPHYQILPLFFEAYDIALLRVIEPFDFAGSQGSVAPVLLPDKYERIYGFITVIGWGETGDGEPNRSGQLRSITLAVLPVALCTPLFLSPYDLFLSILNGNVFGTPANFCAGGFGKNSLRGDSGGPAIQYDGHRAYVRGIVRGGIRFAPQFLPGAYTRVSYFRPWIEEIMDYY